MSKSVLVIDSQILNNYQECPAKAYYMFGLNVRPLIKAEALDKGDLLHQMMKVHYKALRHNQQGKKPISLQKTIELCTRKAEQHLIRLDLDVDLGQEVIRAYVEYAQYYANDNWQILEVEKPFAYVLHENDDVKILYVGIIDLLTTVAIVDHKSSARRGEPTGLSNQFMGYACAFGVNNVVINKIGFQKTLKAEDKFERYTKSYPKEILDEWQKNTTAVALDLWRDLQDMKTMSSRRNFTSCDKYSGCIYQKICGTIPEAREFVIATNYKIGDPWVPVKGLMK